MSSAGQRLVAGRIPGERIATEKLTTNSSAFSATFIDVASITASLKIDRIYKIVFDSGLDTDTNGVVRLQMHEDTSSGTRIQIRDPIVDTGGTTCPGRLETEYQAVASGSKTFVVRARMESGGGSANIEANSQFPAFLYVDYIRDA